MHSSSSSHGFSVPGGDLPALSDRAVMFGLSLWNVQMQMGRGKTFAELQTQFGDVPINVPEPVWASLRMEDPASAIAEDPVPSGHAHPL
jgi:hypothetical protein